MTKRFFITGTDTGVGKTIASAILTLALRGCYWKPIQSGMLDDLSDRDKVQQLTGLPDIHFFPSSYLFNANLSPDQAALLENRKINLNECHLPLLDQSQACLIEGAGGVIVPLNDNESMLDLMNKLNVPIVIVCRGTLGTINHTLLTIETLRHRGLTIHGIIFNGQLNKENQRTIEKWGKIRTLLHVPFFEELTPLILQTWVLNNSRVILENMI